MERAMGIEPTCEAWEAPILPLNYARLSCISMYKKNVRPSKAFFDFMGFDRPSATRTRRAPVRL